MNPKSLVLRLTSNKKSVCLLSLFFVAVGWSLQIEFSHGSRCVGCCSPYMMVTWIWEVESEEIRIHLKRLAFSNLFPDSPIHSCHSGGSLCISKISKSNHSTMKKDGWVRVSQPIHKKAQSASVRTHLNGQQLNEVPRPILSRVCSRSLCD